METLTKLSTLALIASISFSAYAAKDTNQTKNQPAATPASTQDATQQGKMALNNEQDKISYSIGIDLGNSFKQQELQINDAAFMQGIKDGRSGNANLMTEEEIRTTLVNLQKSLSQKQNEQMQKMAAKNLEDGKKFLAENKKKNGVTATASGLQYRVIRAGNGPSPKANDIVTTNYRGTFIDGKEFDSSYSRGEPAQFQVDGVIPGWTEALQLMQPGAKWEIVVPPNLAYGEHGVGRVIGPNSTLVFEIELLSIDKTSDKGEKAAPKAEGNSATNAKSKGPKEGTSRQSSNK